LEILDTLVAVAAVVFTVQQALVDLVDKVVAALQKGVMDLLVETLELMELAVAAVVLLSITHLTLHLEPLVMAEMV
jgi:hypothetical protein